MYFKNAKHICFLSSLLSGCVGADTAIAKDDSHIDSITISSGPQASKAKKKKAIFHLH